MLATSALESLKYYPNRAAPQETQKGFIIYSGGPRDYPQWVFKTELKMQCTTPDKWKEAVERLIESLRGDALQIAMRIGAAWLTQEDKSGIDELKTRMKAHVYPQIKEEVKALHREGLMAAYCHDSQESQ